MWDVRTMGKNYYARINICECCGRYDEIHIGKSSFGWRFAVEINEEYYKTLDELNQFLNKENVKLVDEYGKELDPNSLFLLIEDKKDDKCHFDDYPKDKYADDEFADLSKRSFS